MKKGFTVFALILTAIAMAISSTACSTGGFVLPQFASSGDEYTIEHINNIERSYVLYSYTYTVGGVDYSDKIELKQDDYTRWDSISFAWVIKKGDETVGFIITSGGSKVDKKDKTKYSYGLSYSNSKTFDSPVSVSVYFIGKNAVYMENNVALEVNCGSLDVNNINDDDIPGLAVKNYIYDLSGVSRKDVTNISFILTLK